MRIVLFVDTNLFLQCRAVKSLPWDTISEGNHVVIMIARPVQQEIDRLKSDGNARRAKRARLANGLIRDILSTDNRRLALSGFKTVIELTFPPDYSKADLEGVGEWVDLTRPDHELVATALLYKNSNVTDKVYLLTNDTLPMLTAKRCSLPYRQIPEDWQLPPEPDDRAKRIKELELKLTKLEHRQPMIGVISTIDAKNLGPENTVAIVKVSEASEEDISNLLTFFKDKYPIETKFPKGESDLPSSQRSLARLGVFGGFIRYYPPSDEAIKEYQENKYPKWLSDLRNWILTTQHNLIETRRYISVRFDIANTGEVPVVNSVVEFFGYGGVLFCPPGAAEKLDDILRIPEFPKPPSSPSGEWRNVYSTFARLASILPHDFSQSTLAGPKGWPIVSPAPSRRDRYAFYWKGGRPSEMGTHWAFECEEFRHKVEPKSFNIYLYFPIDCAASEVSIKCRVTGSNLTSPFNNITTLRLAYQEQKAIEILSNIINETE